MRLMIGIDPGVKTGYAAWCADEKRLLCVDTLDIVTAMLRVRDFHAEGYLHQVRIEDARMIGGMANTGHERLQGAGSVKRDCSVWEAWCKKHDIPALFVSPKSKGAKWSAEAFKRICKYTERTSQHGRDAAVLVFGSR